MDSEIQSKKRLRNPNKHKQYLQKVKVQKGLEHATRSRKIIIAKTFCEQTKCLCGNECFEKINATDQNRINDGILKFTVTTNQTNLIEKKEFFKHTFCVFVWKKPSD